MKNKESGNDKSCSKKDESEMDLLDEAYINGMMRALSQKYIAELQRCYALPDDPG